jgi:outer membrane lipoprotein SlyB
MRHNPLATYTQIGAICGGTAGIVQAIAIGGPPVSSFILAVASGAVTGAIYGYLKLRSAAAR